MLYWLYFGDTVIIFVLMMIVQGLCSVSQTNWGEVIGGKTGKIRRQTKNREGDALKGCRVNLTVLNGDTTVYSDCNTLYGS